MKRIVLIWVFSTLSGCALIGPYPVQDTSSVDEAIDILRQDAQMTPNKSTDQPAEPSQSEVETTSVPAEASTLQTSVEVVEVEPPAPEPRFDLQVDAAEADEFFRSLVMGTSYNMVVHPQVHGQVSLSLQSVTVAEVMEIMRDVYGYDYTLRGQVYQVYPDVLRTEIYHLNYLNLSRSGRSEIQVSAGNVSDAGGNGGGGNGIVGGNNFAVIGGGNQGSGKIAGSIVNTDGNADLWQEVSDTLKAIVEVDDESSVMVTPQVGLVVVKAKPQTLRAVADYLGRVENTIARQVVLEAKIIEVTLNDGFQAGINWNTFGDGSGGTFDPVTIVGEDGTTTTTQGSDRSVAGELVAGANDIFNPLGTAFSLSTAFGDFESTIDLLSTQGSIQVLSSPRIATVNNQKAVIKVGSDEFFVTDISTNTVTAGSAINVNDSPQLTPFFSGIALDVTPQISSNDEVVLHVHPTVSEVTEQLRLIGGELVPLASSTIRESDSIVRAKDGQIIVIGGLMQNSATDVNAGVPLLSRLPLIGHAFKQKNKSGIKSELVILLKPNVVDLSDQTRLLGDTAGRLEDLRARMRKRG